MKRFLAQPAVLMFLLMQGEAAAPAAPTDSSSHKTQFVGGAGNVKLEVLDWGGSGRPLVLLAGGGDTAHVFDEFAPRFTDRHHVYGITRRGFGRSDKPAPTVTNYMSDRLGDDVLAVIGALRLEKPVLAGHSIAGAELSSIGSRFPERVAGLVYLDAHGATAYYDPSVGNYAVELAELQRRLRELSSPDPVLDRTRLRTLLESDLLKRFEASAGWVLGTLEAGPELPGNSGMRQSDPSAPYKEAMSGGAQMYSDIKAPILAIAALPHDYARTPRPEDAPMVAMSLQYETRQTDAFEKGLPAARVVRIPYASHYVFRSNEDDVVSEMNAFMDALR